MKHFSKNIGRRSFFASAAALAFGAFSGQSVDVAFAKTSKNIKYRIFYYLNGGTNPKSQIKKIRIGIKRKTSRLRKPSRLGYRFVGWYSNKELTKKAKYVRGLSNIKYRSLWARWKAISYAINYELFGGTQPDGQSYSYTIESKADLLVPTLENARFYGWYSDDAYTTRIGRIPAGTTGDRTVYARWLDQPSWDDAFPEMLSRAQEAARKVEGHGESFLFITDLHLDRNAMKSASLLQTVYEAVPARRIICGGDVISYSPDKAMNLQRIDDWLASVSFAPHYMIRGNHDMNEVSGALFQIAPLTDEEYASKYFPAGSPARECDERSGYASWLGDRLYSVEDRYPSAYCIDNETQKIRYVVLDTGSPSTNIMHDEQIDWMVERILELGKGWTVLVLMHQLFKPRSANNSSLKLALHTNGEKVCTALDSIYDYSPAAIIGVLSGHTHRDYYRASEKGYLLISTICDAYKPSSDILTIDAAHRMGMYGDRKAETVEEQAFDLVSIDTSARKLYLTRFGFGVDQEFSY